MATWPLTGVLLDAQDQPVPYGQVTAVLVDPSTGEPITGDHTSGSIVKGTTVDVAADAEGAYTLPLTASADIKPEGSAWLIRQVDAPERIVRKAAKAETMHLGPDQVEFLDDSASPVTPAAVEREVAAKAVAKSGDTMAGDLDLAGNRLTGLPAPAAASDAARQADVDATLARDGSRKPTADLLVDGHAIREAYGALIEQTFVQSTSPTDLLAFSPLRYRIHATVSDSTYLGGPAFGVMDQDSFGLPAFVDLTGRITVARTQSTYSSTNPAFSWGIRYRNSPGMALTFVPAWGYQSAPIYYADGATVSVTNNDGNNGGAGFFDCQVWTTANSGAMDATDGTIATALLSAVQVLGNAHLSERVVIEAYDVLTSRGGGNPHVGGQVPNPAAFSESYLGVSLVPGQDQVGGGTVDRQTIIRIPRLVAAAEENVGIENASATVHPPLTVELADATSTIEDPGAPNLSATLVVLEVTAGGALTLTSTPSIQPGIEGQTIHLLNGSDHAVVIQGEGVLAGSGVQTAGQSLRLEPRAVATLTYSDGRWSEHGAPLATGAGRLTPPTSVVLGGFLPAVLSGLALPGDSMPRVSLAHSLYGPGIFVSDGTNTLGSLIVLNPDGHAAFGDRRLTDVGEPVNGNDAASFAAAAGSVTKTVAASRNTGSGDVGATLLCSTALTITATNLPVRVGTSAAPGWPLGARSTLVQAGAGAVTVAAASGLTLHAPNGAASTAPGQEGTLRRISATVWSITWH